MNRRITRKIDFDPDEIRDALIALLDKNGQAIPAVAEKADIILGPSGASLTWEETHTLDLQSS